MKVLVADEHLAVRAGLRAILGAEPDMEMVGEATEGGQAIVLTEQLQPDIVLLDVFMIPMGGIEACRAIKAQWPAIKVLVMSELAQLSIVRRALEAGANGYLVKNASKGLIIQSVRAIYAGGLVLPQDIGRRLLMDHSSYLN